MYYKNDRDGLLTGELDKYTACLQLQDENLNPMLNIDQAKWTDDLESTKKYVDKMAEKIHIQTQKHQMALEKILNEDLIALSATQQGKGKAESKFTLRRLPMWGEEVSEDEINFFWPSQIELDKLPEYAQVT